MESLYNLVNKTTGTSKQSKIQIGYSIDGFNGVLEALKEAQNQMVSENGNNPIFNRWTESSVLNEKVNAVVDGFVVDDKLNPETYRQQQCIVKPYMSFVISLVNEKGETQLYYVPFTSNRTSLDCGTSVSSKNKFPIAQITKEYCESSGIILGSMSSPFEVGIGVDLSESGTAESFFERCYKEIYVRGMAKKLAEKGLLFAEIVFPTNSSTKIVNIKVTVDSGVSEQGKAHCIYFPFPLLLTNEYKNLCKVQVNSGSYTTVGDGGCTYPFNTANYDYKKATLSGFTPQCVNDIIKKDGKVLEVKNPVLYQFNSVTKDFSSNACYIRFYLDSSKNEDIVKIIGKDIPDVYKTEIYNGRGEANMSSDNVYSGSSSVGIVDAGEVAEFWEQIGKMLKNPLSGEAVVRAINQAGKWESGGDWGMWEICGSGNGDGEGVSAGKFQFTQRAGGIKKWKKYLLKRGGTISSDFSSAIDRSITGIQKGGGKDYLKLTYSDAAELLGFAKEFAIISNTKEGMLAQLDVWKEEKGDTTIDCYNMLGCTTAAEFSSIFSAVNHHPAITKNYKQWLSYIQSRTNGIEKVRAIENAHWAAIANYYYQRNATPSMIDASYIRGLSAKYGKGWANRYNDSMNVYKTMC